METIYDPNFVQKMLKSIHFWTSVFWLYENKALQLTSAGASLKRFGEKYLVFIKCKSCKHCFKKRMDFTKTCQFPLINYLRTEAEAVWTTQLVGSRLLSRLEEDPGAGDIVAGVHVCSRCNRAASCNQKVSLVIRFSWYVIVKILQEVVKVWIFIFLPKQNHSTDWEASVVK